MLAYEICMFPLPTPTPGEVSFLPMVFPAGTVITNVLNNFDGTASLRTESPKAPQEHDPVVEFCVYFCPPDPNNPGAWLVPQPARLGHGGKVIGQTEGKTHIIIGTKAE